MRVKRPFIRVVLFLVILAQMLSCTSVEENPSFKVALPLYQLQEPELAKKGSFFVGASVREPWLVKGEVVTPLEESTSSQISYQNDDYNSDIFLDGGFNPLSDMQASIAGKEGQWTGRLSYQIMGQGLRQANADNISLLASIGYGENREVGWGVYEIESDETSGYPFYVPDTDRFEYNYDSKTRTSGLSLVAGYRLNKEVLFFSGLFYQNSRIDGSLNYNAEDVSQETFEIDIDGEQIGLNVGARIDVGPKGWYLMHGYFLKAEYVQGFAKLSGDKIDNQVAVNFFLGRQF